MFCTKRPCCRAPAASRRTGRRTEARHRGERLGSEEPFVIERGVCLRTETADFASVEFTNAEMDFAKSHVPLPRGCPGGGASDFWSVEKTNAESCLTQPYDTATTSHLPQTSITTPAPTYLSAHIATGLTCDGGPEAQKLSPFLKHTHSPTHLDDATAEPPSPVGGSRSVHTTHAVLTLHGEEVLAPTPVSPLTSHDPVALPLPCP